MIESRKLIKRIRMLINDDCLLELRKFSEISFDALITDPPAGISFMNKSWDKSTDFIQTMTEIYKECLRVLKPGAHGLVWAIPRTSHWTATALEQAGFEIRDVITHVFGSGFPKSLDVSKAIDKNQGVKEWKETTQNPAFRVRQLEHDTKWQTSPRPPKPIVETEKAKQWNGWGTALKPASEHWILIRRLLGESTVAKNVLKHGTGGLNIDASRVCFQSEADRLSSVPGGKVSYTSESWGQQQGLIKNLQSKREPPPIGRFPANFVLSHNEDCEDACTEGCAVKMMDEQEDNGKAASRFFYCSKASKRDRGEGNSHPTVKSTKLMEYLIRLITPPHGKVLDPFMGSGSTGVAAKRLGFEFVGIEKDTEYFEIAKTRIEEQQKRRTSLATLATETEH